MAHRRTEETKYSARLLSADEKTLARGEASLDLINPCVIFRPTPEHVDAQVPVTAKTIRIDGLSDFEVHSIIPLPEPIGHWKVYTVV